MCDPKNYLTILQQLRRLPALTARPDLVGDHLEEGWVHLGAVTLGPWALTLPWPPNPPANP